MLTIRLRVPSGTDTVKVLPEATFSELRALIASTTSLSERAIVLSNGFPPKILELEDDTPIGASVHDMDTIVVSLSSAASGQAVSSAKAPNKRQKKGNEDKKQKPTGSPRIATVASLGSSPPIAPAAPSSKRSSPSAAAPARAAGGGGGFAAGKRRGKTLHLESEESIGASLVNAVSGGKAGVPKHSEDPAAAFLKAASQSALAHHVEEVRANERFQVALLRRL